MSHQSYVDASRIVVAGTSHGGLVSVAYGTEAAPGVRGIINFSGGLRHDLCDGWQKNLVDAFDQYGAHTAVRSLWLYGDNDSVWTPLVAQMHDAYVSHGTQARFIDFGRYKDDAHRLIVDRDGVPVWWPAVNAFLAQLNLPTSVRGRGFRTSRRRAAMRRSTRSTRCRMSTKLAVKATAVSEPASEPRVRGVVGRRVVVGRRRRRSDGARARQLLEAGRRFVPAVCGQRPGRVNDATQTAGNDDGNARDTGTPALASR